jgi:glycosyltransferase involved in cell wall biosynthesis
MVVLCAANSYDEPGTADWHMAEHLSRLVPVLYCDPPRPIRSGMSRGRLLRAVRPGLARLTPPAIPFPSRRGMTGVTTAMLREHLRRATVRLGGTAAAVISAWPLFPVAGACGESVTVCWVTDDHAAGADLLGLDAAMLERRQLRVAAEADLVAVVSPVLRDKWAARGRDAVLIPNGADTDGLADVDSAPLPGGLRLPSPVAGFIGRINGRADLDLLAAVAGRWRSLLLVGPADPALVSAQRFLELCARSTVQWTGPIPASAIPGHLAAIDVGLVPYADTAFNRASFPIKTLEYLAAGRAAVSTPLPSSRWLGTGLITIADGPQAFADAVQKALDQPRTPELVRARQAFAAQHSWQRRAEQMLAAVTAATQRKHHERNAAARPLRDWRRR